ncbi:hypothetical protein F4859DRAFT_512383 [Xylaria cf. heliscus]|nr:hypothetical protein F4859DRAFT_512383 [Xylaria cf. heliscus]
MSQNWLALICLICLMSESVSQSVQCLALALALHTPVRLLGYHSVRPLANITRRSCMSRAGCLVVLGPWFSGVLAEANLSSPSHCVLPAPPPPPPPAATATPAAAAAPVGIGGYAGATSSDCPTDGFGPSGGIEAA